MELMNKDFSFLTKPLPLKPAPSFKQDEKLVSAIDKLFRTEQITLDKDGCKTKLPERKLQFREVQQLLSKQCPVQINTAPEEVLRNSNDNRKALVTKIENILGFLNKTAEEGDKPKLVLRNQRLWSNCIYDSDRVTLKAFSDAKKTTLCYSSSEDKTRFNSIVFVLTKVHELISKNMTITRRELFYQNVIRFRNQGNLDVAVRDVCCLLETPPWNLGLVATAKGLLAGPIKMHHRDGSVTDCSAAGGTLIPLDVSGIIRFVSTAKYILVVEKDAVFQKLLDEGALIRLGPVIILTGKGYPDVCTRQILCRMCTELQLKALALVDADPHGYEIFLTYKYGSLAQSHLSSTLACSSLVLLGARHHDVMTLAPNEARLPLTDLDKRKLTTLMKRPYLDSSIGLLLKKELNAMLASGIKAEIEALAPTAAALCDAYLPAKLIQGKNDPIKRKSFNVNEAIHSLDLALGRLKRSKMVHGEYSCTSPLKPVKCNARGMFMDMNSSSNFDHNVDNASLMSMNFSHYELMRNLSHTNCNSDGAFSGTTCSTNITSAESSLKDEHLERYFRSAEIWRNYKESAPSVVPFEMPEK
ncbi:hypothetical protein K1T71_002438 [Dendrolimus kikuchii]|uniref:Uncharacterized protein n=1 Tax=Dendrolimus kikuchii TaxID=765133 RepID=A0ACC1DD15_9NEOP|nr:hypothetical protein K1T71_002438 [Dendrolimus kikuchii]